MVLVGTFGSLTLIPFIYAVLSWPCPQNKWVWLVWQLVFAISSTFIISLFFVISG